MIINIIRVIIIIILYIIAAHHTRKCEIQVILHSMLRYSSIGIIIIIFHVIIIYKLLFTLSGMLHMQCKLLRGSLWSITIIFFSLLWFHILNDLKIYIIRHFYHSHTFRVFFSSFTSILFFAYAEENSDVYQLNGHFSELLF